MTSLLTKFLLAHKSIKGQPFTHTRIGDTKRGIYGGCYNIPPCDLNEFFELYYDAVFVKGHKEYLTEVQNKESGLVYIDMDFNYAELGRHHTPELVDEIVNCYLDTFKKYLQFGCL